MSDPIKDLKGFARKLRDLPRVLAIKAAAQAAPAVTALGQSTFNAGANAYGDTWAPGAEGQRVTLRKSGGIASGVVYVAIGTRIRSVLTMRYARYQIGKRPVYPRAGAALPTPYIDALEKIVVNVATKELAK